MCVGFGIHSSQQSNASSQHSRHTAAQLLGNHRSSIFDFELVRRWEVDSFRFSWKDSWRDLQVYGVRDRQSRECTYLVCEGSKQSMFCSHCFHDASLSLVTSKDPWIFKLSKTWLGNAPKFLDSVIKLWKQTLSERNWAKNTQVGRTFR